MNPLSLDGQHGEVEGDELQVAGGRGVVAPPQLLVEHLGHGAHAGMDLHAHLSYRFLGGEGGGGEVHQTETLLRYTAKHYTNLLLSIKCAIFISSLPLSLSTSALFKQGIP